MVAPNLPVAPRERIFTGLSSSERIGLSSKRQQGVPVTRAGAWPGRRFNMEADP